MNNITNSMGFPHLYSLLFFLVLVSAHQTADLIDRGRMFCSSTIFVLSAKCNFLPLQIYGVTGSISDSLGSDV